MPADQAVLALAGRQAGSAGRPEHAERATKALEAVAARAHGVNQSGIEGLIPDTLREHVEKLRAHPSSAPFFKEGYEVALVDLTRICAAQPCVFTDSAVARVRDLDADDFASLAAVSLPLPTEPHMPVQFDETRQAWIVSGANPNLRIVGHWGGPVPDSGAVGFGFLVRVNPSYMSVANCGGRYVLRDGYHRAYGFLHRGITSVPAFVRNFGPLEDLGLPPGLLPRSAYLGDSPPTLSDYFEDTVAARVEVPAAQKLIVIHGMELGLMN